jgi:hypothetical protein
MFLFAVEPLRITTPRDAKSLKKSFRLKRGSYRARVFGQSLFAEKFVPVGIRLGH